MISNPIRYPDHRACIYNADVSEAGGGITSNDALAIQKFLLGLVKSLPESYAESITNPPVVTTTTKKATTTTTTKLKDASQNDRI